MMCERESELKVKRYAENNRYTILANTFGALEYVKYDYSEMRVTKFLKWPKGSDTITVTVNNKSTKIKLSELKE
tara:strand:+ start:468 stop:689 length:222 start_codon:yes stop_codon:yes gene_type:complete